MRGDGDLDAGCPNQLRDAYGCPRGSRLFEVLGVNPVHLLEQAHVSEIDLNGYGVFEAHAGLLQDQPDIIQRLTHFGFEIRGNLPGLEVLPSLSGDIQRVVHQNSGAERRAARELLRMNRLFRRAPRGAGKSNTQNSENGDFAHTGELTTVCAAPPRSETFPSLR